MILLKSLYPAEKEKVLFPGLLSAGNRNRTSDLLITNELLYRLSYAGIGLFIIGDIQMFFN